ncbi:hypothetical protein [Eubacterium limosum]|uniref:Uncharacterized protein n=1 Tax=Eubacterium limosum TaxID=1736 RepID=A0ABT5UJY7_EUBLI|nr:hypothetical protein [Eubacterium limosum]MDE1469214.1 hypothetical protein [Eubacterium limosum]
MKAVQQKRIDPKPSSTIYMICPHFTIEPKHLYSALFNSTGKLKSRTNPVFFVGSPLITIKLIDEIGMFVTGVVSRPIEKNRLKV